MDENEFRGSCCPAEKFYSEICAKKVSVFGGCLTFEQQRDVNSGRLSMCAETCAFPERVVHCIRPVLSNLNIVAILPEITGVSAGLGQ